jgi:hypothetical protein
MHYCMLSKKDTRGAATRGHTPEKMKRETIHSGPPAAWGSGSPRVWIERQLLLTKRARQNLQAHCNINGFEGDVREAMCTPPFVLAPVECGHGWDRIHCQAGSGSAPAQVS